MKSAATQTSPTSASSALSELTHVAIRFHPEDVTQARMDASLARNASTNASYEERVHAVEAHLCRNALRYFPGLHGKVCVHRLPMRGSTAQIVRFQVVAGALRKDVVAKWAPIYKENNEGLTEYYHYKRFNDNNTIAAIGCPTALDFLAEGNVLLTEAVPGESLLTLLRRRNISRVGHAKTQEMDRAIQLCGIWLRKFHSLVCEETTAESNAQARRIRGCIPKINALCFGDDTTLPFHGSLLCKIRSIMQHVFHGGFPGSCQFAQRHGDFGPGNILVDSGSIAVLDITRNKPAPTVSDLAYFTVYLDLMPYTWLMDHRLFARYKSLFLAAYFGDRTIPSDQLFLFHLFELEALLKFWLRQNERMRSLPKIVRWVYQPYWRLHLGHLLTKTVSRMEYIILQSKPEDPQLTGASMEIGEVSV